MDDNSQSSGNTFSITSTTSISINSATVAFNGSIDEVMIFNRSLSADEISDLYSKGRDIDYYDDSGLVSWWGFDKDYTDKKGSNDGTAVGGVSLNSSEGNGLVGYWHFDGDALDSSGEGNNGTLNGGVANGTGVYGGGFVFDGDGGYVDVGNSASLAPFENYSISAWIKPNIISAQTILSKSHASLRDYSIELQSDGDIRFIIVIS